MVEQNWDTCRNFAELLFYPGERVKLCAADCARQLKKSVPEAASAFAAFIDFLEREDFARIEELYTTTFDLQALCQPYVGYQLCGENQARTLFLMKLQEIYKRHGFSAESELPDHLGVLLRFIADCEDADGNREIIRDALLPALTKMLEGFESNENPYQQLLSALSIYLTACLEYDSSEHNGEKELSHG